MGLKSFVYLDFKVKLVDPQVLLDFAAMNFFAAKTMGFKDLKKEYEIWIDFNLPEDRKERDLKHEVIEFSLMKYNKLAYWQAHKIATACENYDHDWEASFYNERKCLKDQPDPLCFTGPTYQF